MVLRVRIYKTKYFIPRETKHALTFLQVCDTLVFKKSAWLLHQIGDIAPPILTLEKADLTRCLNSYPF